MRIKLNAIYEAVKPLGKSISTRVNRKIKNFCIKIIKCMKIYIDFYKNIYYNAIRVNQIIADA